MPQRSTYSTPRWVKVVGIIVIILIMLVVVVLVTGVGGEHGPRRHIPSGDAVGTPSVDAGDTLSVAFVGLTSFLEHSVQRP